MKIDENFQNYVNLGRNYFKLGKNNLKIWAFTQILKTNSNFYELKMFTLYQWNFTDSNSECIVAILSHL